MLALTLVGHLASRALQVIPAPVTTLFDIRDTTVKSGASGLWRLTESRWDEVWGVDAFGIGILKEDVRRYRFRVPPDHDSPTYPRGGAFLVESYLNGFPVYGLHRNGQWDLCRPLGFRYGRDGTPTKCSVRVWKASRWTEPKLTKWAKQDLLNKFGLFEERFAVEKDESLPFVFGTPWFQVAGEGSTTYWVDRDLHCLGPYGNRCTLTEVTRTGVEEILRGERNAPPNEAEK